MNTNFLRVMTILLFVGALFFGWYGYQLSKAAPAPVVAPPVVTYPQVIALRKINAGEMLAAADVSVIQVESFNAAGFKSPHSVYGRLALSDIEKDSPIMATSFQQLGPVAELLKSGERAVAIKVDEVSGVGGYIKPGDHVDVLLFANDDRNAKRSSIAQVVLNDLRVISFGEAIQETENNESSNKTAESDEGSVIDASILGDSKSNQKEKPSSNTRSAVLAVKELDTTKLMLAASIGQLRLALRGEEAVVATSMPDSHFIRSDVLLIEKKAEVVTPPKKATRPATTSKAKTSSSVIVHYGDNTQTVILKDSK